MSTEELTSPFDAIPESMIYRGFISVRADWAFILLNLAGLSAGLAEEVYFRGLLYGSSRAFMGRAPAMVVNVLFFAACHTWAYSSMLHTLNVAAYGTVCVILADRYGSITPAIVCHVVANAVQYNVLNLTAL